MNPFSCIAIDMGAGSIRIVQGIFEQKITLKEIYRFDNACQIIDGHYRWDIKHIRDEIGKGLSLAFANTALPILSVGVDSWGVDFVLIDKEGNLIETPVAYRDTRTDGMKALWNNNMGDLETFKRTGINYNIYNSLYQFLSIKNSHLLTKTHRILFMADYINFFLSGTMANELSLASTTQMLNVQTKNWDLEITSLLGIENKLCYTLTKAGEKLGLLKGFHNTQVIAVAGHDTACAVASIPFFSSDSAFISTGTWCIAGYISEKPALDNMAFEMGITNEITFDGKFRPLTNLMGLWLIQQLRIAFGQKHSYDEIDEMAEALPPSKYLIDTKNLLFYNPANMKEAFDQYLLEIHAPLPASEAAYYRCAYDSMTTSLGETITKLEALKGKSFKDIRLIGGGVKSKFLCQLISNKSGKKVIAGPIEGATIGNLKTQALAIKKFTNANEADAFIEKSVDIQTYYPLK